jgi:hypothetical protein
MCLRRKFTPRLSLDALSFGDPQCRKWFRFHRQLGAQLYPEWPCAAVGGKAPDGHTRCIMSALKSSAQQPPLLKIVNARSGHVPALNRSGLNPLANMIRICHPRALTPSKSSEPPRAAVPSGATVMAPFLQPTHLWIRLPRRPTPDAIFHQRLIILVLANLAAQPFPGEPIAQAESGRSGAGEPPPMSAFRPVRARPGRSAANRSSERARRP